MLSRADDAVAKAAKMLKAAVDAGTEVVEKC